jgi:bifunctional UDP-N-acetylglucosamine pyrophosphorylase/glucosamine-1-phosphate N-acetyltransferase
MKSARAKVAHELLGKPLIRWVVDAAKAAGSDEIITVVGHAREQVIPLVENDTTIVVQEERLGTGHALMVARASVAPPAPPAAAPAEPAAAPAPAAAPVPAAAPAEPAAAPAPQTASSQTASSLVVLCGDTPLITSTTIAALVALQQESGAAIGMLTHFLEDPTGYGRVIRDARGDVVRIVEEKDATAAERAVRECNSGAYSFDTTVLWENLRQLGCDNAQGEYYLTDLIDICVAQGQVVKAQVTDAEQTQGINSRTQLAQATRAMQRRINAAHLEAGVTMLDPALVWIGPDVTLENDVELLPLTLLGGTTRVASGSVLGPNVRVTNSVIGRDCRVDESVLIDVVLEDGVSCGPRAYLRPGTVMRTGSKAGTHVEIKNSIIGPNSKVPHLSYLGDALLGEDVNIGAGTITCNYDGAEKNPTMIGDRAFIGSDTMFVAPVTVGTDTVTGAGSVITADVPDGALALERTKQHIVRDWTRTHSRTDSHTDACGSQEKARDRARGDSHTDARGSQEKARDRARGDAHTDAHTKEKPQ